MMSKLMEGVMEILHMTLKRKWFDLIASGKKKKEYRIDKPYWIKRLFDANQVTESHIKYTSRDYDEIHFRNGYGKNVPFMRVEYLGSYFSPWEETEAEHGEKITCDQLVVRLGKVLEVIR